MTRHMSATRHPPHEAARALKAARREEARAAMPALVAAAYRVRERDPHLYHVTLWATANSRPVQWWPGAAKWTLPGEVQGTQAGSPADLVAWLGTFEARFCPDDGVELIDDEADA